MGWQYVGVRGSERVQVYAVSVLTGFSGDDSHTEWRVDDSVQSQPYSLWEMATRFDVIE
jgi:hypothetical protein